MADFRKLLFALVAVTLLFTTVASAQPYSCNANAVPTLVRSEGIADLTGDILLNCSGVVPANGIQANIRVRLNTSITSNILSGTITDSILLLDELANVPGNLRGEGAPFRNVYQGTLLSDTELEFLGVQLAAAGSAGASTIRITNVRANASALGTNATIFATVNITGSTTVPVNNNSLVVADTRPGMKFSISGGSFKNCELPPSPESITLEWEEGFASAFRTQGDVSLSVNQTPGGAFPNESGYNPGALAAGTLTSLSSIGQATQGTRLMARVSGFPSGVTLEVPQQILVGSTMILQAVTGTNSDGGGGTVTSGTGTVSLTDRIVYEVTWIDYDPLTGVSASLSTRETVVVPVTVTFSIPGPLGAGTAKGTFAPLSTVFSASATAPEPRFIDNAVDADAFSIGPCRTLLLFPFVTHQAGFDTGLAISNTSMDPIGTANQEGACSLYYYGNTSGGPAPTVQTSPTVPAGGQLVFQLSTGGGVFAPDDGFTACTTGNCVAPMFQGYIFAVCDFQFAHGYAFISDFGSAKLSQGYLALIIPDRSGGREPQDSSLDANPNEGENTGN